MVVDGRTTVDGDETAILAMVPARTGVRGARVGAGCGGVACGVDHRCDCGGGHVELVDGRAAACAPGVLSLWSWHHYDAGGCSLDQDSGG